MTQTAPSTRSRHVYGSLDLQNRLCSSCRQRKPQKGGTSSAKGKWRCAQCKAVAA